MKIMAIPNDPTAELRIHSGPHFGLRYLMLDARGEYAIVGPESYFHDDRRAHVDAGHTELCSFWVPTFQRGEVWTVEQKRSYMENIFRGYDVGSLMITSSCTHPEFADLVIDGQQRLTAVRDFALNRFSIFNNVSYDDIVQEKVAIQSHTKLLTGKTIFSPYSIPSIRVEECEGRYDLLKMLYNTFNFSGTQHTEADRIQIEE